PAPLWRAVRRGRRPPRRGALTRATGWTGPAATLSSRARGASLPGVCGCVRERGGELDRGVECRLAFGGFRYSDDDVVGHDRTGVAVVDIAVRSEEHTSELQSRFDL